MKFNLLAADFLFASFLTDQQLRSGGPRAFSVSFLAKPPPVLREERELCAVRGAQQSGQYLLFEQHLTGEPLPQMELISSINRCHLFQCFSTNGRMGLNILKEKLKTAQKLHSVCGLFLCDLSCIESSNLFTCVIPLRSGCCCDAGNVTFSDGEIVVQRL